MKNIFRYSLFGLATALSLWQLGCAANSNPAKSNAATETNAATRRDPLTSGLSQRVRYYGLGGWGRSISIE